MWWYYYVTVAVVLHAYDECCRDATESGDNGMRLCTLNAKVAVLASLLHYCCIFNTFQ